MKKIINNITFFVASILIFSACETDNYDGPDAHISGRILDHNGNLFNTEQGSSNMRIKMEELSWAKGDTSIAIIPTYLNVKIDGTYNNTKIFKGQYRMTPIEGAFYPYDEEGEIVDIKGSVKKDFVVTPYLEVEWVREPQLTDDNRITASIIFNYNTPPSDTITRPTATEVRLFISSTQYVGNNNYYSDIIAAGMANAGIITLNAINNGGGREISLRTSRSVKYTDTRYYVRVGVRCNDQYQKYSYTSIIPIDVP